jgi:hypothetical protein
MLIQKEKRKKNQSTNSCSETYLHHVGLPQELRGLDRRRDSPLGDGGKSGDLPRHQKLRRTRHKTGDHLRTREIVAFHVEILRHYREHSSIHGPQKCCHFLFLKYNSNLWIV